MRRLAPFVVLLLFIAGLFMGVPLLFRPDKYRPQIAQALTDRLGHPVTIGQVQASYFPPRIKLRAVTVEGAQGQPLFQGDQVDVPLDVASLFRFRLKPEEVLVTRWTAIYRRQADGRWEGGDWVVGSAQKVSSSGWNLKRIALQEGEWQWQDSYSSASGRILAARGVAGEFDLRRQRMSLGGTLQTQSPVTFSFEGQGAPGSDWAAELTLSDQGREWKMQVKRQGVDWEAQGTAVEWPLSTALELVRFIARLPEDSIVRKGALLDWRTHISKKGTTLAFRHGANLEGGSTVLAGSLAPQPDGLHLTAKGQVTGLPVALIENTEHPLLTGGKLRVELVEFDLHLSSPGWGGMRATVDMEVTEGRYRIPVASQKSLAKAKTMKYLDSKFPNWTTQGFPFKSMGAQLAIADGFATVSEGKLVAEDMKAALVGKVDLMRKGSDAYFRLQLAEKSKARIRLIPGKYLYGSVGKEKIQPMFGRLQGTWSEWSLRAIPTRKIPQATQAHLQSAIKKP